VPSEGREDRFKWSHLCTAGVKKHRRPGGVSSCDSQLDKCPAWLRGGTHTRDTVGGPPRADSFGVCGASQARLGLERATSFRPRLRRERNGRGATAGPTKNAAVSHPGPVVAPRATGLTAYLMVAIKEAPLTLVFTWPVLSVFLPQQSVSRRHSDVRAGSHTLPPRGNLCALPQPASKAEASRSVRTGKGQTTVTVAAITRWWSQMLMRPGWNVIKPALRQRCG